MDLVVYFIFLLLMVFGGSALGVIRNMHARRLRHKLDMAKEKTKLAQAEARMLAEQNRKAELELERFDRRHPGTAPAAQLPSEVTSDGPQ